MFDQKYLKSVLKYDHETGVFVWKKRPVNHFKNYHGFKIWNSKFPLKEAGYISKSGYFVIGIDSKRHYAHRLAWFYVYGSWPENQIDHISGNKADNRIDNLREANKFENQQNLIKHRINNKCGYLGVHREKNTNRYHAQIKINKKTKHIGFFSTPEEAHNAYIKAKRELHKFCTI